MTARSADGGGGLAGAEVAPETAADALGPGGGRTTVPSLDEVARVQPAARTKATIRRRMKKPYDRQAEKFP